MKSRIIFEIDNSNGITEAIFYVDGKYVYEPKVPVKEIVGQRRNECIYRYWTNAQHQYLYNGRVELVNQLYLRIDGTLIFHEIIGNDGRKKLKSLLTYPQATDYLNQIETVGVDKFFNDYKSKIQKLKEEMGDNKHIYVASSWRNEFYPEVVESLRKAGFDVYDFRNPPSGSGGFKWEYIDSNYMNWTPQQYKTYLHCSKADQQFNNDIEAMKSCGCCVLVLPCGRSAHTEAGWFAGKGRKVIAYIPTKQEPELMYKLFDGVACSITELISMLKND